MKICKTCNISKDIIEYHKHPATKDRLEPKCKPCKSIFDKKVYHANKEKRTKQFAANHDLNRDKRIAQMAIINERNRNKKLNQISGEKTL